MVLFFLFHQKTIIDHENKLMGVDSIGQKKINKRKYVNNFYDFNQFSIQYRARKSVPDHDQPFNNNNTDNNKNKHSIP